MGWRSPRRLDKLRGGNNNINGIQKSLLCLCLYVCVYDPCEINCVIYEEIQCILLDACSKKEDFWGKCKVSHYVLYA